MLILSNEPIGTRLIFSAGPKVSSCRFHAREGQKSALRKVIHDEIQQARSDIGCLAIDAYASVRDGHLFFIHSRWVDSSAFDVHAETPHAVHFIQLAEALVDHPLDVNRTKILELPARLGGEGY